MAEATIQLLEEVVALRKDLCESLPSRLIQDRIRILTRALELVSSWCENIDPTILAWGQQQIAIHQNINQKFKHAIRETKRQLSQIDNPVTRINLFCEQMRRSLIDAHEKDIVFDVTMELASLQRQLADSRVTRLRLEDEIRQLKDQQREVLQNLRSILSERSLEILIYKDKLSAELDLWNH